MFAEAKKYDTAAASGTLEQQADQAKSLQRKFDQMRKFNDSIPLKLLKARESTMAFFRPILQEAGLTEQQWRVIRALNEYEELESKQLAELCCILSPSLTGIINRLESQGHLKRRKSTEDQRRVLISLTDQAKQLFKELSPRLEGRYGDLTNQISKEKLQQLNELLSEIIHLEP
ncbi:homoprotocatechuate degradation operon regulator HpaR [Oceanospirillum linum]|uniref:homoprotocatechuate degradation operon regulator HpaR n=1 Tax=Oceanospirillum linum TaxID=966 RepID=UPI00089E628D|nr:homoprotocatechuate degradation operon regulator HpaR [Oceanospirillum linum]SEF46803.1 homoprotocatechuate degradation operon regulator, HpaR [Oleiphilus messinensis]SMP02280.1 homoprotocatechuate degradation operon regulator, HpaR [Oceanospirillum linum]